LVAASGAVPPDRDRVASIALDVSFELTARIDDRRDPLTLWQLVKSIDFLDRAKGITGDASVEDDVATYSEALRDRIARYSVIDNCSNEHLAGAVLLAKVGATFNERLKSSIFACTDEGDFVKDAARAAFAAQLADGANAEVALQRLRDGVDTHSGDHEALSHRDRMTVAYLLEMARPADAATIDSVLGKLTEGLVSADGTRVLSAEDYALMAIAGAKSEAFASSPIDVSVELGGSLAGADAVERDGGIALDDVPLSALSSGSITVRNTGGGTGGGDLVYRAIASGRQSEPAYDPPGDGVGFDVTRTYFSAPKRGGSWQERDLSSAPLALGETLYVVLEVNSHATVEPLAPANSRRQPTRQQRLSLIDRLPAGLEVREIVGTVPPGAPDWVREAGEFTARINGIDRVGAELRGQPQTLRLIYKVEATASGEFVSPPLIVAPTDGHAIAVASPQTRALIEPAPDYRF
ncbi:MAG: hypothetical protein AAGF49_16435, partial [Pseudomonadota bacterium]